VKALREARERAGHKQAHVARLIGVSQVAIHFWETGKHQPEGRNREKVDHYLQVVAGEAVSEPASDEAREGDRPVKGPSGAGRDGSAAP